MNTWISGAQNTSNQRYAAKLLFQYKFDGDEPGTMRSVEEKIIIFSCMSAEEAFA